MKERKMHRFSALYALLFALYSVIFYVFLLSRIRGKRNVPREGGLVLMCNHIHWIDPLTLALCVPRRQVHFMGKVELFQGKVLGSLLRSAHAFPVGRGQFDMMAIREAMAVLRAQCTLGIFPEGTRYPADEIGPLHSGASVLALKSNVPVVPVYVHRPHRWYWGVRVQVGMPIAIDDLRAAGADKQSVDVLTARIREALEALRAKCVEK